MSPPVEIHLIALDPSVAQGVKSAQAFSDVDWISHDSLAAFERSVDLEATPSPRCILAAADAESLPADWQQLRLTPGRTLRLVVALGQAEAETPRRLMMAGACSVIQAPWAIEDPDALFRDQSFYSALFRGRLRAERREVYELSIPSARECVAPVVRFLCERFDALDYPAEWTRSGLPLVLDEALTNAMEHGHRWDVERPVELRAELWGQGFELRVSDHGSGFDRSRVASPLPGGKRRQERGRGLYLLESLVDEVIYEDGGRTIVLRSSRVPSRVPVEV